MHESHTSIGCSQITDHHRLTCAQLPGDGVGIGCEGDKIVSNRRLNVGSRSTITAAGTGASCGQAATAGDDGD